MMRFLPVCALLALSGCLYSNVVRPRAYRTAGPSDVKAAGTDELVSGEACMQSVLYLFAWGDSGFAAATRKALSGREGKILYDVRTDIKTRAYVLGLYAKACTVVTGRVGLP